MGLFESLLGGGAGARQPQQRQQQQDFQDFIDRYEQGPPWAGVSDQEAVRRYQQVAPHVTPEVYEQSAREAFARMAPQERAEFARYLRQQARGQGVDVPDLTHDGVDDRLQDPAYLAQVTGRLHRQQPGLLGQLLGGPAGGSLGRSPGGLPGGAPNRAVLEAIQIRNDYEAARNTPTDQWLKARGMTQAQLDAALALAAGAGPQIPSVAEAVRIKNEYEAARNVPTDRWLQQHGMTQAQLDAALAVAASAAPAGAGPGAGLDVAGMLGNPLARAALAGIAAMAAKRMLSGR
jgi:hypothetical protein